MKKIYVNRELEKEIEDKFRRSKELDSHLISSVCQKRARKGFEANAQIQSFRIENPQLAVPFSVPRSKKKRLTKEGIYNIKNAFEWGRDNFDSSTLNEDFVKEIAGKILPDLYNGEIANYRASSTRITGASNSPPDPYKVKEIEMPNFVLELRKQLECPNLINKVESAIYSHFHFVRIHPLIDGNGRTARVLQDVILDSNNIPVPIIESGERMTYYDILDEAVNDWKHNGGKERGIITDGEKRFYNFIAGKINISLEKLLEACNCN